MEILDKLIYEAIELRLEVGEFRISKFHYNELKKMVESSINIKVYITKINYYKGIPVILHSENGIACTYKLTKL